MAITFIEKPGDFPGTTDKIDWKNFPNSIIKTPLGGGSGSNVGSSSGGLGFRIDNPSRSKLVRQGSTWEGNFSANETLVYTWKRVGPIMLVFDSLIRGVGAGIQEKFGTGDSTGAPYTGIIRIFGAAHNPLAMPGPNFGEITTFSDDGTSHKPAFVGAFCDQPKIKFVEFDTRAVAAGDFDGDFAVGRVTILT